MFVRLVKGNGSQLITCECNRVIHSVEDKQMELELLNGNYQIVELDDGDRVFLMNNQGNTFDSMTIGD
jgi:hypothetical protein